MHTHTLKLTHSPSYRDVAESMLQRQQQLEDLAEKEGLITFDKDGNLMWVSEAEREAAKAATAQKRDRAAPVADQLERAVASMMMGDK